MIGAHYKDFLKGKITLVECFVRADNDFMLMIKSGIYEGKDYDKVIFDRNRCAIQLARICLLEHGYILDDFKGFLEWNKDY